MVYLRNRKEGRVAGMESREEKYKMNFEDSREPDHVGLGGCV